MAGSVKLSALMGTVMVCALGVVQCAAPAPRVAHRSPGVVAQQIKAQPAGAKTAQPAGAKTAQPAGAKTAQPALQKTALRTSSEKTPAPMSGCSALLDRYKHEASHIPYPANLPIRPLLSVGDQLVRRYDRLPARDRECRALVRMTLERFFVRSLGPGVAPAPKLPVAKVD